MSLKYPQSFYNLDSYKIPAMKKILLLPLFISIQFTFAQPYYLWDDATTYSDLSAGTDINGTTVWDNFDLFTVPIGFDFEFMDQTFTSLEFEATGRIVFDAAHYYFADMFVVNGLQDKGVATSMSTLSYEVTGSPGTQIFKLQIKNATFAGDLTATIDLQIWLYEEFSRLELRMGPNTIPSPAGAFGGGTNGPYSGIHHLSTFTPITYVYGLFAYGDENNPEDSLVSGTGISSFGIILNDCPAEGKVYVYGDAASMANIIQNEGVSFQLYPNPVENKLTISGVNPESTAKIVDMGGRLIMEFTFDSIEKEIDLSNLSEGVYQIKIEKDGVIEQSKFVKQ